MATRTAIPSATKLRLFSHAAGHCQRPTCLETLFPVELGGDKHIAEMAHVIPYAKVGPRHEDRPAKEFDPNTFENLILLCPTCHTMIDKDPDSFPRAILLEWKQSHLTNLATKQGVRVCSDRSEVQAAVAEIMSENKAIWDQFAPVDCTKFEYDPESEVAQTWRQRMRSVIHPNHFRAVSIIQINLHLATKEEFETFALYREHVRGLSERHICGGAGRAMRFPNAMEDIFS
jgi:HNH endonuclease